MANRLQLKRGTTAPGTIFYEGEPIYNKTGKVLYVGDDGGTGTGAGSSIASADAYASVLEMLYKTSSADSGSIRLYEDTDNGTNYVAIAASTLIASNFTLRLPNSAGTDGYVLKTDGTGNLDWVAQTSGFSGFTISDSSNTSSITDGNTITFSGGTGITATVTQDGDALAYTLDTELQALSSVTSAADALPYFTGSGTASVTTLSSFGRTLIDDADAATARTTLDVDQAGTDNSTDVTLVTTTADYLSIDGQAITLGQIDLATDVTGSLPNGNLANSTITVSDGSNSTATALGGTITFNGTANEVTVSESSGTITVGLPDDVTIGGSLTVTQNLNVLGTAVTFSVETTRVEDRVLELGLVNGAAPSATTTWDTGVAFNYFQTSAKKSGVVWLNNQFMAMLSELSESADTGNADPQITATAYAPVAAGGLYIGGIASGNEVINSSQAAVNLTFDGGTY